MSYFKIKDLRCHISKLKIWNAIYQNYSSARSILPVLDNTAKFYKDIPDTVSNTVFLDSDRSQPQLLTLVFLQKMSLRPFGYKAILIDSLKEAYQAINYTQVVYTVFS